MVDFLIDGVTCSEADDITDLRDALRVLPRPSRRLDRLERV